MNQLQRYNQRVIKTAINQSRIITSITLKNGILVDVEQVLWDEYWSECNLFADELEVMKNAWFELVSSGFQATRYRKFVQAYFSLLSLCIQVKSEDDSRSIMMTKLVGFEVFRISNEDGITNAGIFSNRNPAYMLSRLAHPEAPDNPKYLPLVRPNPVDRKYNGLFSHYRRIPISGSRDVQLFVYTPVEPSMQPASHALVGRFFKILTPTSDPWVKERSKSLFDCVFENVFVHHSQSHIELLDMACGSGRITMDLCRKGNKRYRKSFGLTLLDVTRLNKSLVPAFYRNPDMFHKLEFQKACLFKWLECGINRNSNRYDISLMLRVLDLYGHYRIKPISRNQIRAALHGHVNNGMLSSDIMNPAKLIASDKLSDLQLSIKRLDLQDGWTFLQLSLSEYYRAMAVLTDGDAHRSGDAFYTAIRCFDENILVLPNGDSLISRLLKISDKLVIEDMEVTTACLRKHIEEFSIPNTTVTDMAKHRSSDRASVTLIEKST